jgi:hypothetical protein
VRPARRDPSHPATSESVDDDYRDTGRDPDAGRNLAATRKEREYLFERHHAEHVVPRIVAVEADQKKIAPPASMILFALANLRRQVVPIPAPKSSLGKRSIRRKDLSAPLHALKTL